MDFFVIGLDRHPPVLCEPAASRQAPDQVGVTACGVLMIAEAGLAALWLAAALSLLRCC